ncbi:MAG TPA: zinc carboxypeptidase, partial [Saprospiraceae bacterium]|nr:zinc carboxypeptidase [Saprospiraceae bacterium]
THPLSFGLGEDYYSLKTDPSYYKLLKDASNPVYIPKGFVHYGFIGSLLKPKLEETVSFAVERKGGGSIVYMVDNRLFRGFWVNGQLLFSNAVFFNF